MSDQAPFAALLAQAREGDRSAVEQLIALYEPQVRLVARNRLGPALRPYLDSADLVQSVHRCLMIGFREDKFRITSPDHLLALALTLVQRKVARQWRRMQRQVRFEGNDSRSGNLLDRIFQIAQPEDPATAAAIKDQVSRICAGLNELDRRLIEMRLEGYSTIDVARELNVDPHLLRVRLSRLRERLRTCGVFTEWL